MLPALDQHPQAAAALPSAVSWVHAGRGEPDAANASSAYLHALRRHWVAAVVLGLVCGAAAATVVVLVRRPVYAAIALLRVAVSANVMVYEMPETRAEAGTTLFDIYKNTQSQQIKSRYVLQAALRDREIAALPSVREHEPDAPTWLAGEINVTFPEKGEIMQVGLVGCDPVEITKLVNAVVGAYMREVVDVERNQRVIRRNELDKLCADKETEVRNKRNDMKQLADQLGTQDSDTLSLKQQAAVQQYADYQRQLMQVRFEAMRAQRPGENGPSQPPKPRRRRDPRLRSGRNGPDRPHEPPTRR